MTFPESRSEKQRLNDFPVTNWPVKGNVDVYWNKNMIPFVEADFDEDCAFALGVVHAHLRLGQMEMFRRLSAGRLAESGGPFALPKIDRLIRTLNLQKSAELAAEQLDTKDRLWMERFVEGINYFQEQTPMKPKEMDFLSLDIEPWTVVDAIRVGRLASMDANWSSLFSFLPFADDPEVNAIWSRYLESGSRSVPSFSSKKNTFFNDLVNATARTGSNSIVVGGKKTTNGAALIASDPHLGIFVPNLWILIGYRSPSYQVIGYSFPAVPAIALGRNQDIAWGGTYMRGISSHLFAVNPKKDKISIRKETIGVRYWFDKVIEIRETSKGPIISDALDLPTDSDIALSWAGYNPSNELGSYLSANRAKNWTEFSNAFSNYAVSGLNLTYADRYGNIGMLLGIRQPILKDNKQFFSLVKDSDNEIVAYVDPTALPKIFNPDANFIVSANNAPIKTKPPIAFVFGDNDRINRLNQLVSEQKKMSIKEAMVIQQDVFSQSGLDFKNWLIKFADTNNQDLKEYWTSLDNWNGHYTIDSKGPVAFELITWKLAQLVFEDKIKNQKVRELFLSSEDWRIFLKEDMEKQSNDSAKNYITRAMRETFSSFREFDTWGDMHVQILQNPLGLTPLIGNRFRFGEFPAPGGANTVHKNRFTPGGSKREVIFGAQVRHVSNLGDLDENYFVMLGGNDGWLTNPHLYDQTELWRKGEYVRLPLSSSGVKEIFNLKTHKIQAQK